MIATPSKPIATQLQDEIEYGDKGMFRKYLVKDEKRQAMLICLQAGIHIPEHTSSYDGLITVIRGRGKFQLAGREVLLEPGVFIELPANTLHALTAVEDLALLKVVDSYERLEPVQDSTKVGCQKKSVEDQPKQTTCAESLVEMLKLYVQ